MVHTQSTDCSFWQCHSSHDVHFNWDMWYYKAKNVYKCYFSLVDEILLILHIFSLAWIGKIFVLVLLLLVFTVDYLQLEVLWEAILYPHIPPRGCCICIFHIKQFIQIHLAFRVMTRELSSILQIHATDGSKWSMTVLVLPSASVTGA